MATKLLNNNVIFRIAGVMCIAAAMFISTALADAQIKDITRQKQSTPSSIQKPKAKTGNSQGNKAKTAGKKPKIGAKKNPAVKNDNGQGVSKRDNNNSQDNNSSNNSQAQQYLNTAYDYYDGTGGKTENHEMAFDYMQKAAELGNAEAQAMLGYFYRNGIGCTTNYKNAVHWYRQAANRGNLMATNNLGFCYQYGYGVTKDGDEALAYYTKAAKQGYAVAMKNLGICYQDAIGINAPNMAEAGRWFRKAVMAGDESAQEFVDDIEKESLPSLQQAGDALNEGKYELAYGYMTASANMGNDMAQALLGDMTINGIGTTQNYTTGLKWLEMAADQENCTALNYLGEYYENGGAGLRKNANTAFNCFSRAHDADPTDEDATYNLGRCYRDGIGCTTNRSKAIELFQIAADAGHEDASDALLAMGGNSSNNRNNVNNNSSGKKQKSTAAYRNADPADIASDGMNYLLGEDGFEEDPEFGFQLVQLAADKGNEVAMNVLGICYTVGFGCDENPAKAFYWHQRSADLGYASAQYYLGKCYENGTGTKVNMAKALEWYRKAAAQGDSDAAEALARLGSDGEGGNMMDAIDDI